MTRKRSSILDGLEDAVAFTQGVPERGRKRVVMVPVDVDVKAIRKRQKLSQGAFAERFGFAVDSVQNWEQGRRQPEGAARLLLNIIDREPAVVQRVLEEQPLVAARASPRGARRGR
jgi:putative transcriptional regulator